MFHRESGEWRLLDKAGMSLAGTFGWAGVGCGEEVMVGEAWALRVAFSRSTPCPSQPVTPSSFRPAICLQFSGNPTPSRWRIKGRCVVAWPSSVPPSPLQCRNTLALCPGRKTQSPSSPGKKRTGRCTGKGAEVGCKIRGAELVVELTQLMRLVLASSFYCSGDASAKKVSSVLA